MGVGSPWVVALALAALLGAPLTTTALVAPAAAAAPRRVPPPLFANSGGGGMVQVKFRIHPDGRVEETVVGVKGVDCTKVTEQINQKLGTVTESTPTAEMFEKPQQQKVSDQNSVTDGNGSFDTNFGSW